YTYTDIDFLWQFCLWRLQGILEAVMVHTFLSGCLSKQPAGLRDKLLAMRDAGYTVTDNDLNELFAWARLRNALSHAPPEQYRPAPLVEEDIQDYMTLITRLIDIWEGE